MWMQSRRAKEIFVDLFYSMPQFSIYFGVLLLPFIIALPMIFTDRVDFLDTEIDFVGFSNFVTVLQGNLQAQFFHALRRTVIFTTVAYCWVMIISFALALCLYELKSRIKSAFFTIIFLPWMISGVGIGMMIIMMVSLDTGTLNLFIEQELGLGKNVFNAKTELTSLVILPIIFAWRVAGLHMAIFLGGLMTIPNETIESARMDGANYTKRVLYVYIPQIVPSIIMATIVCLILAVGMFDELVGLAALQGNNSAEFISVFVYLLGFGSPIMGGIKMGTVAEGVTVSMLVFLPFLILAYYLTRLQKRKSYY